MREDLRRRLRKLGVVKGVRELATLPARREVAIEDLVPGRFHTTSRGQCFVAEETYPLDHAHGDLLLTAFLDLSPSVVAQVARDNALAGVNLRRTCFLDTETTGLSGGAGTMAFIVGLGFFVEEGFRLRQYFLRDPGDEPAMVETLAECLKEFEVLVSFNGRAFDVPILENRFILARIPPPTAGLPHLDLLQPARRLYRYKLSSCALISLEREVLGVPRDQTDVPGGVIPYLYRDYLSTGDAREMKRVLYHNAVDILSLVTLAVQLCHLFADPWTEADGAEFYGLGRWYADEGHSPIGADAPAGRTADVERAYRSALGATLAPDLRAKVLHDLAYLLKRSEQYAEAFACWQQLALEATDDVLPHVELAKYLEWRVGDFSLATGWTRAALAQVENWPKSLRRSTVLDELRHRLARLERKMAP
jgi:uncharacterized protein YprB with RNaseH-like and TPR domain